MKPLGLKEIADEVGLHESTVSRVTNNKYMATPVGVFELKYFFSRAMNTASGGTCSPTAIRGVIKDMIESETTGMPLSDAEIGPHRRAPHGHQVPPTDEGRAGRSTTESRRLSRSTLSPEWAHRLPPVGQRARVRSQTTSEAGDGR
jgi:hypothetical protein